MSSLRVHCLHEFDAEALTDLRDRLVPEVELNVSKTIPEPADFDVLVAGRPAPEQLDVSPRLRTVVIPWAGVAPALVSALAERPQITLHNIHHNAAPTAEYAVALLLAAAKDVCPADAQMRTLDWQDRGRSHRAVLLEGRRALVLGYGEIGRRVAAALRGIGMTVTGVRRAAGGDAASVDDLDELLPQTDVLMVTLPLTDATRGLIGAKQLALLPRGAIVVNVGRGAVFREHALFEALDSGHLHGAGLDVWWRYPMPDVERTVPSAAPLHTLSNVVMSPHRAGHCDRTEELRMTALAKTLNTLARGAEPPGRVDLTKGY